VLILNPVLTPNQFLRTAAIRLGAEKPKYFKADLIDQVNDLIWEANESGSPPVVIIDEAQLIPSRATFEEIRLLTNFQLDDSNLMALILLAQPEIYKRINRKEYEAFRQRVGMNFDLGTLSAEETPLYIDHRITVAGGDPSIFEDEAKEIIHICTKGVPRKINNLAGNALLEAFAREQDAIGADIVRDAARDLGMAEEAELAA
jgi:type II secretory pathway predicted ATPase ExeA